nr:MAG TPA: hypothetical protein [Caudoviricetes sp.]
MYPCKKLNYYGTVGTPTINIVITRVGNDLKKYFP